MKTIFWNLKKNNNIEIIQDIFICEKPDVMIFCEFDNLQIEELSNQINKLNYIYLATPGCNRISIFVKVDLNITLMNQEYYYSFIRISDLNEEDIFLITLHLSSQMYHHIDELKSYIRELRFNIDQSIGDSLEKNFFIIGDFNVNPFESPIIAYDGLCATNGRKPSKSVNTIKSKKNVYINPTWKLYSRNEFPGTIKYKRPSGSSFDVIEWHYLDQVIINQKLNENIKEETIYVLENTKNYKLFDKLNGKVFYSYLLHN